MNKEKTEKLNSINFTWQAKRKRSARKATSKRKTVQFEVMFDHLVSFQQTYGHTKVNKMEKEWKKGTSVPKEKVYRRLPIFLAYVRKEQLLHAAGKESSLDEEKIQRLTDLGVEWRMPAHEPRKCTGSDSSRKKKQMAESRAKMEQQQVDVEEYNPYGMDAAVEMRDEMIPPELPPPEAHMTL